MEFPNAVQVTPDKNEILRKNRYMLYNTAVKGSKQVQTEKNSLVRKIKNMPSSSPSSQKHTGFRANLTSGIQNLPPSVVLKTNKNSHLGDSQNFS